MVRLTLLLNKLYTHYATVETGLNSLAVLSTSHCLACSFTAIAYIQSREHTILYIIRHTHRYTKLRFAFNSCWSRSTRLCIYRVYSVLEAYRRISKCLFVFVRLFFSCVFRFCHKQSNRWSGWLAFKREEKRWMIMIWKWTLLVSFAWRFFSVICPLCLGSCIRERQLFWPIVVNEMWEWIPLPIQMALNKSKHKQTIDFVVV